MRNLIHLQDIKLNISKWFHRSKKDTRMFFKKFFSRIFQQNNCENKIYKCCTCNGTKDQVLYQGSDWDYRFLMLAKHISLWSKDNSTKVGCVIADRKRRIISVGYNGLPMG